MAILAECVATDEVTRAYPGTSIAGVGQGSLAQNFSNQAPNEIFFAQGTVEPAPGNSGKTKAASND